MIDRLVGELTREVSLVDTPLARAQKLRVIYQAQKLHIQGIDLRSVMAGERRNALMGGVNGVFSSSFC